MASSSFISKQKFNTSVQEQKDKDRVLHWTDLEEGVIYKIVVIDTKQGKFGECFILTIEEESGTFSKVWSPNPLIRRIKQVKKPKESVFFTSLGQARRNNKTYNNFDIHFEKSNEVQNLFTEEEKK